MTTADVYDVFYKVRRLGGRDIQGVTPLSDGGGPFGFDIHAALAFDHLVEKYRPDVIFETGCHVGDTTEYLARLYPHITLIVCDVAEVNVRITARRTASYPSCRVLHQDSRTLLRSRIASYERPLLFLDAHWSDDWPLEEELQLFTRGVACIDDFFIADDRYGFDQYNGEVCGPELVYKADPCATLYINNTEFIPDLPNHQLGRRAGRAYLVRGEEDPCRDSRYFKRHSAT